MKHYIDQVLGTNGLPIQGATVTVHVQNAAPGTGVLATIYSGDGVTPIAGSVVTTDNTGTFDFYAPDGRYDLVCVAAGTSKTVANVVIQDLTEADASDAIAALQSASVATTLRVGDGTAAAPSIAFSTEPGTGIFHRAIGALTLNVSGVPQVDMATTAFRLGSGQVVGFSSNANPTLAVSDVGLSRTAAGTVAVGNGTQGDASGTLLSNSLLVGGANPLLYFSITPGTVLPGSTLARRGITYANDPAGDVTMWFNSAQTGAGYFFKDGTGGNIPVKITPNTLSVGGSVSGFTGITAAATASGSLQLPTVGTQFVSDTATQTLTNKTIDTAGPNTIKVNGNTLAATAGTATVTVPNSTDTLVGKATSDTLTNKTISSVFNTLTLGGNNVSSSTGTGAVVFGTSPTITTPVISSIVNTGTLTLPTSTDTLVGRATTDTLTNKRVTPRIVTMADAASVTPTSDTADVNIFASTQIAGTLTVNAPTGTPTDGQRLVLRLKSTNAQTYSFNATYAFSTSVTAPTTLSAGKTDYIGLMWNATNTKWDVVAVDQGH